MRKAISLLLVFALGGVLPGGAYSMGEAAHAGRISSGLARMAIVPVHGLGGIDPYPALKMINALQEEGIDPADPLNDVSRIREIQNYLPSASPVRAQLDQRIAAIENESASNGGNLSLEPADAGHHYVVVPEQPDALMARIKERLHEIALKMPTPHDRVEVIWEGDDPLRLDVPARRGGDVAAHLNFFGHAFRNLSSLVDLNKENTLAVRRELRQKNRAGLIADLDALVSVHDLSPRDIENGVSGGKFGVLYRLSDAGPSVEEWTLIYEGKPLLPHEMVAGISERKFTWDELMRARAEVNKRIQYWKSRDDHDGESALRRLSQASRIAAEAMVESSNEELKRLLIPDLEQFERRESRGLEHVAADMREKIMAQNFGLLKLRVEYQPNPVYSVWLGDEDVTSEEAAREAIKAGKISKIDYAFSLSRIKKATALFSEQKAQREAELRSELKKEREMVQGPFQGALSELTALMRRFVTNCERWLKEGFPSPLLSARVLRGNKDVEGAPVVVEEDPTPERIAAALEQAAGGFLVMPVLEILRNAGAWPTLMRALRATEAQVVLIVPPLLLMILRHHDPDFKRHFEGASFSAPEPGAHQGP